MDLTGRAYEGALRDAGLVEAVVCPESLDELAETLRSTEHSLVVSGGNSGSARPEHSVRVVRIDCMGGSAQVDRLSHTLDVPAWWPWSNVEDAAREEGLTLAGLVDTHPSRSVGGTLSSPDVLPALWMAGTARGACIGMRAVTTEGDHYAHLATPRTASGPDLRAVFFGSCGVAGAIVRVTLRAEAAGETRILSGSLTPALQPIINELGSVVSGRGTSEGVEVRVRLGSRLAAHAETRLAALGFVEAARPSVEPTPAYVATVPWDELDSIGQLPNSVSAHPMALGPTHVAFGIHINTYPVPAPAELLDWGAIDDRLRCLLLHGPEAFA